MLRLCLILYAFLTLIINAFPQVNEQKLPTRTEKFVWRYGSHELGTLEVPNGFIANTENYTEGIVTRLRYPDGSCFVLQRGFMYRIPLFQDPENILDFSKKKIDRTIRRGHYKNKTEVWGEVDYTSPKLGHPEASIFEMISPNIGYEHVPRGRSKEFVKALESFSPPH
jgi:hypothetical protein